MYLPCIKPSFKTVTDFSDRLCFVEALFPKGLHLLFKDVDTRDFHTRTMNTLLAVHIRSQSYHFTRFKWFYLALWMATALEEKTLLKGFGSLILLITWGTIIKKQSELTITTFMITNHKYEGLRRVSFFSSRLGETLIREWQWQDGGFRRWFWPMYF